jgi:hypothetical protein
MTYSTPYSLNLTAAEFYVEINTERGNKIRDFREWNQLET